MSAISLLALAGVTALAAKLAVLTVASRMTPTPVTQRVGRHVLAATTAAVGAPALVSVASNPDVGAAPAVTGAAVGVAIAARGGALLLSLPAAVATCAALSLALH